ncbi:hypothetical protein IL306_007645 [Fusarium sp. DS 682]|nr:hypothetical protein IL306_007645 [Fusarium sp. DS 682]
MSSLSVLPATYGTLASCKPTASVGVAPSCKSTASVAGGPASKSTAFVDAALATTSTASVDVAVATTSTASVDVAAASKPTASVAGSSVLASRSEVSHARARYQRICAVLNDYEGIPDDLIRRLMRPPKRREEQRRLVWKLRKCKVSYAHIKELVELDTSLSTLRGWYRHEEKAARDRPRAPVWKDQDICIMKLAVRMISSTMEKGSSGFWRKVEEEMPKLGASHGFSAQAIAAKYEKRRRGDLARKAGRKTEQ